MEKDSKKVADQKIIDIGDKTGSPHMYPDNGDDKGRGEHITSAKRISRKDEE